MRTNKKLIITLTVFVLMLLASIYATTVFAETTADEAPEVISDQAVVSGCDLKKEDLQMVKVGATGFSMLIPKGEYVTAESAPEEIAKSDLDRSTLIDQNIFFYTRTGNANYFMAYAGFSDLKPLDQYYGNYSSLTKAQQDELIARQNSNGSTGMKGSFEKINGRTYMMLVENEQDPSTGTKFVAYGLYTVIGKYQYFVQIVAANPDKNDLQVMNEILNSIKINGLKEPMSVLDITLIVCVVLLVLAVAFALFTLYRIDRFVKTGTQLKAVIGFDLPAAAASEEEPDDSDDDDDSGDEFDDDEVVETDDENAEVPDGDPSEKIIDE